MKIAIIGAKETSSVMKRLREEASIRGYNLENINIISLDITDIENDKKINFLSDFDVVYFRRKFGSGLILQKIIPILSSRGVYCVNSGVLNTPFVLEKIFQTLHAKEHGLKVPKTYISTRGYMSFKKLADNIKVPFVGKTSVGSEGQGVSLIKSESDYVNFLLKHKGKNLLFQEFIPNSGDYRVFIIDGKVEAMFQRVAKKGQFLNNIAQGAVGKKVIDPSVGEKLSEIAKKTAKIFNLEISGIDIMQSDINKEFYFIEVNYIPGWAGAEEVTGINIGAKFMDFFERCSS